MLELAERNVARLSGGQRQKVYLAMALAQDTPVLLLDEPTTFLDIGCQLELAQLMRETAAAGKAVVMVLHDLNLGAGLCPPGGGDGGGTAPGPGGPRRRSMPAARWRRSLV